jgi:hypothetical protein
MRHNATGATGRDRDQRDVIGKNPTGLGLHTIQLIRELDRLRADLVVYTSCPDALGAVRTQVIAIPPRDGGASLMIDPNDPDGLAGSMDRLLTDRDLGADLRARGLQRVQSFSWLRTAEQISGMLDEVLATA